MKLLTVTRLRALRDCLRKHELRYEMGVVPAQDAEELRIGTVAHVALEARFLGMRAGFDPDKCERLMLAALDENADMLDAFEHARVTSMVIGYHWRWVHDFDSWQVIEVEAEYRAPLTNPTTRARSKTWELGGKIDLVIRERRTARLMNVEHKTSGEDISPGSSYWRKRTVDSQLSMYSDGAARLGYDVAGTIFDVLGKPDLRPKLATPEESRRYTKGKRCKECREQEKQCLSCYATEPARLDARQRLADETVEEFGGRVTAELAEDPERYYQRGEVARLGAELTAHRADVWADSRRVPPVGQAPRNPEACVRGRMTCPYLPLCAGEASVEDTSRFRRLPNVHPELENI